MLNEVIPAANASSLKRIFAQEWDKNLKPLPKGDVFKVCVSAVEPFVDGVSLIPPEHAAVLRKYEESNGFSFPGFNFPPYLHMSKVDFEQGYLAIYDRSAAEAAGGLDDKKRARFISNSLKKSFDRGNFADYLLRAAQEDAPDAAVNRAKALNKIERCIKNMASNLGEKIKAAALGNDNPNYRTLCERLEKISPEQFFDGCFEYFSSLIDSYESWERYCRFFVQSGAGVTVFLDIKDYDDNYKSVAHGDTVKWINSALLRANETRGGGDETDGEDAYGNPLSGCDAKMPSVRVGPLGDVILRSMVKEAPCQFRYGVADYESFPVGDVSRRSAKLALETLAQEQFRGKTWKLMGEKELLFAYPVMLTGDIESDCSDDMEDIFNLGDIPMAGLLTNGAEAEDKADFTALAGQVIAALSGISRRLSTIEIKIFALKKMDKARTKVSYYTNFTVDYLYQCAHEWSEGCRNLPDNLRRIKRWGAAKGEIMETERRSIFPRELYTFANKVWRMDGSGNSLSKKIKSMDGLELLLKEDRAFAMNLLTIFISNSAPLLALCGECSRRGKQVIGDKEEDKIVNPAILALLLYKLGCKKEDYMNSPVFKLGTLLALADSLQYHYCKYVRTSEEDRKKNIVNAPVQLVGNSMLSAAETRTRQTIGILGARIRPYLTWARTDMGEDMGLSRWMLKQFSVISFALAESSLPESLGPIEKSELYLGYMAGVSGKTTGENENDEGGKQNG